MRISYGLMWGIVLLVSSGVCSYEEVCYLKLYMFCCFNGSKMEIRCVLRWLISNGSLIVKLGYWSSGGKMVSLY